MGYGHALIQIFENILPKILEEDNNFTEPILAIANQTYGKSILTARSHLIIEAVVH